MLLEGKRARESSTKTVPTKRIRSEETDSSQSFSSLVSRALEQQARENELQAKKLELEEKRLQMEAHERSQQQAVMLEVCVLLLVDSHKVL